MFVLTKFKLQDFFHIENWSKQPFKGTVMQII